MTGVSFSLSGEDTGCGVGMGEATAGTVGAVVATVVMKGEFCGT